MRTTKKLAALKGNNVITKYFPLKDNKSVHSQQGSWKSSYDAKKCCSRYHEVDGVVILSDTDSEGDIKDSIEVTQNNSKPLAADKAVEMVSVHIPLNDSANHEEIPTTQVASNTDFHPSSVEEETLQESNTQLNRMPDITEHRNVFNALLNTSNDRRIGVSKGSRSMSVENSSHAISPKRKAMQVTSRRLSCQTSSPKSVLRQSNLPTRLNELKTLSLKRKQLTMDSYVSPKKHKLSTELEKSHTEHVVNLLHDDDELLTSATGNNFAIPPGDDIIDLTADHIPETNLCNDKSRTLNEENHLSSVSAISSETSKAEKFLFEALYDRDQHYLEYETGYESDAEPVKSDVLSTMYSLFDAREPITELSPGKASLSSSEDGDLPEFSKSNPVVDSALKSHSSVAENRNAVTDPIRKGAVENCRTSFGDKSTEAMSCSLESDCENGDMDIDSVKGCRIDADTTDDISCTPDTEYKPDIYITTPIGCSASSILEVLKKAESVCVPITPRKAKAKKIRPLRFGSFSEDSQDSDTEKTELNTRRLSRNMSRMVNDKKRNETIKSIEEKWISDVKKGGFSRYLNDSSDEELPDDENEEYLEKLNRIFSTKEDCLGLEEKEVSIKIFSRKRLFHWCCPHRITPGESILPQFLTGDMDLQTQLIILAGNISFILTHFDTKVEKSCDNFDAVFSSLVRWLLQILSTNFDPEVQVLAEKLLCSLLDSTRPLLTEISPFYAAISNLGFSETYMQQYQPPKERSRCKKCRLKKLPSSRIRTSLPSILKAFRCFLSANGSLPDAKLHHLLLVFSMLLLDRKLASTCRSILVGCIEKAVLLVKDWKEMRLSLTKDLLRFLDDVHDIRQIVELLSSSCERLLELRQCLCHAGLSRCFSGAGFEMDNLPNQSDDETRFKFVESLAKKLTLSNMRSSMRNRTKESNSRRELYNTMWSCVLLLQPCLGKGMVSKNNKATLESVTDSLRNLNLSIRDDGFLFCSEAKHFIRITTALAEFQLQEMPKTQLYQQRIFKFLGAPRVDEEIIEVEHEDSDGESISSIDCEVVDTEEESAASMHESVQPHADVSVRCRASSADSDTCVRVVNSRAYKHLRASLTWPTVVLKQQDIINPDDYLTSDRSVACEGDDVSVSSAPTIDSPLPVPSFAPPSPLDSNVDDFPFSVDETSTVLEESVINAQTLATVRVFAGHLTSLPDMKERTNNGFREVNAIEKHNSRAEVCDEDTDATQFSLEGEEKTTKTSSVNIEKVKKTTNDIIGCSNGSPCASSLEQSTLLTLDGDLAKS